MATDRDALRAAIDALEEIALAGMSGSGQESEEGMRDWHARQAWKFIGIAARALEPARAALAAPPVEQQAAEPDFWTACAWIEGGGEAGWIPLPGYSNETAHGVKNLVLEAARKEGYKGTVTGRLMELGWEVRPVYLVPQPAPQAGAAEPALRPDIQAVLLELDVPVQGYLASHAGTFLKHAAMMPPEEYPIPLVRESDHRRACRKIAALATHPTEQPSQDATEEFVGYLCCAWGESDLPVAELVRDLESVGRFMVRQWLGAADAQDYDGTPTLPRLMTEWQDHDWDNEWSADFEIGGVSVERLHCTVPAARAAQAQGGSNG